jgi:hypothetical protein
MSGMLGRMLGRKLGRASSLIEHSKNYVALGGILGVIYT